VASCSSYTQFTHDFDFDSVKHESAYTPFATLVFCSPINTLAAPDTVYNSALCATARQDPQLSAFTSSTAGQTDTSGAGTGHASGAANSSPVETSTPTATPSPQRTCRGPHPAGQRVVLQINWTVR